LMTLPGVESRVLRSCLPSYLAVMQSNCKILIKPGAI